MPCGFRWRFNHLGSASLALSCVCTSLSLPCPVRRPAVAMGCFLTLDLVVRCSSTSGAEIEFWRPETLCWSPVRSTLRNWKISRSSLDFRGYGSGFLPPTAGRSFIGGTSSWSGSLLRVTANSLAFGLATAVFRCGGGFAHEYGLSPVFPSFGSGGRRRLGTLDALCIDRKFFFRSILASSRLSLLWVFSGLVQVLSCLTLSVPVGVRSVFSPAGFSSLWLCLAVRILLGYFLRGFDSARVPSMLGRRHCRPCRTSPPFLGHFSFLRW